LSYFTGLFWVSRGTGSQEYKFPLASKSDRVGRIFTRFRKLIYYEGEKCRENPDRTR
jgi:hypothetical protein